MTHYPHANIFLERFVFAETDSLAYPSWLINELGISSIEFAPITIFYGGNGSGKSTLLNIIGRRMNMPGCLAGNDADEMQPYIDRCEYELRMIKDHKNEHRMNLCQLDTHFIRSEVIMNSIIAQRRKQFQIKDCIRECSEKWDIDLYDSIYERDSDSPRRMLSDFERNWLNKIGYYNRPEMESNGQTAMRYFDEALVPGGLFLLDEPENSLSPKYQKDLARIIEQYAYLFGAQFIISTHSPFLLAMSDVKIYDLDSRPVEERPFTELENMRLLYELMHRFEGRFRALKENVSDSELTAKAAQIPRRKPSVNKIGYEIGDAEQSSVEDEISNAIEELKAIDKKYNMKMTRYNGK